MSEKSYLQLNQSSILNVPFQMYDEFTFIVNDKKFKTTRLIADLLSPKICQNHINEPTLNEFIINTKSQGDFSLFLHLIDFKRNEIPENEVVFISEIAEQLCNDNIYLNNPKASYEINEDNIFTLLKHHNSFPHFYSKTIEEELEFISSHFYELFEHHEKELKALDIELLERILNKEELILTDENQLLKFINELYIENSKYDKLYEFVCFTNVDSKEITEFIDIYNIEDISSSTWRSISERLKQEVQKQNSRNQNRYQNEAKEVYHLCEFNSNEPFNGLFNYLQKNIEGNIEDQLKITSSSTRSGSPRNVILYNNKSSFFQSYNNPNSWLCFDLQNRYVIPNYYSIRSHSYGQNCVHPKSWAIEGSLDGSNWDIINEQKNCSYLNGSSLVHSFPIQNENNKKFRCIRIRQTSTNWCGDDDLMIGWFELFGKII